MRRPRRVEIGSTMRTQRAADFDVLMVDGAKRRSREALQPLLTLAEVATVLQLSEKTVRRLVASRRIPCLRLGRQLRFVPGDVFRWIEALKE
jgi:excisionase family DNA binding protein